MPPDNDGEIVLEHEGDEMADAAAEAGNMAVAMTVLAQSAAAASARRTDAADQLALDSQRMWAIAMTTPTVMAAKGMQIASEAGSGRTRIESNTPAGSQTIGGGA